MKDKRYGLLKHYVVYGRLDLQSSQGSDREFEECVTTVTTKFNVDRIGDLRLTPATPYAFKI